MSIKYIPLTVKNKTTLTPESASFELEIPEDKKDLFSYKPGQYIGIRVILNKIEFRREYSLCSSPYLNEPLTFAAKYINSGIVSKYLVKDLKPGDTLEVLPPRGNFTPDLNPANSKVYFLIAGGSGVTPMLSIAKSVLKVEEHSKVILYYGNYSENDIMFRKEIDELSREHPNKFFKFYTLENYDLNWKGLKGKINVHDLGRIINDYRSTEIIANEFYICGPLPMMDIAKNEIKKWNISDSKINIEFFTPPVPEVNDKKAIEPFEPIIPDEIPEAVHDRQVKITLDNEDYNITVKPTQTILEAAMEAGLDPPYSCRSGICTTCRAKLFSGKVKMDEREGLSDAEIEEGYILTCQSHPITNDVTLEYM